MARPTNHFLMAIQLPNILANHTDPKLRGQHLSEEQEHSAKMWLSEHHPEFLLGIMAFKTSDPDCYPASKMHANIEQAEFSSQKWRQINAKQNERNLSFPLGFVSFSSASAPASIERYFLHLNWFGAMRFQEGGQLSVENMVSPDGIHVNIFCGKTVGYCGMPVLQEYSSCKL
ncbi:hypothetical protein PR048_018334 [Dryococelus australis]|uniref:Uncharacterized protein n=1 Tax=Dryococelus australis TaxID=614101 RepID=A0ABQ9HC06_9NEOP|nr:hypothetical protein PR048_018334 [Dryococelus australis]